MNSSSLRSWSWIALSLTTGLGTSIRAQDSDQSPAISTGLQALEGCVLVQTDWADGDSFRVAVVEGFSMTVRLYGADCLEWHVNDPSDARRLRAQRRYFGISEFAGPLSGFANCWPNPSPSTRLEPTLVGAAISNGSMRLW
jgi:hypothetical protein